MNKENKNQRFRRLAEKRVNIVLDRIRIVGNLSNKGLYDYSESEIRKIFSAIDGEVRKAKSSFQKGKRDIKEKFSFND